MNKEYQVITCNKKDCIKFTNILNNDNEFNFYSKKAIYNRLYHNINWNISLKIVNNSEIIGGILLDDKINCDKYKIYFDKDNLKGVDGYLFYLKKKYRNKGYDKILINKFVEMNKKYNFDFILAEVYNKLRSHAYYKRLGFKKIENKDKDSSLYLKKL